MSFLETKPAKAVEPVWPTLDPANRSEIVAALARLIAKAVVPNEVGVDQEVRDE
ncbi:MAG TPA: hypothetical protein VKU41_06455 [Polyangiaceae bacterium]|nr:hypothetical protein [Polyangiaceae bacterium]